MIVSAGVGAEVSPVVPKAARAKRRMTTWCECPACGLAGHHLRWSDEAVRVNECKGCGHRWEVSVLRGRIGGGA